MKKFVWIIGFPRCGSVSLCEALRVLGWNPIHNPRHWDMLQGYNASGDVLITAHWRQLNKLFPDSRFVLNTRNVDGWLKSLRRIPGFWKSPLMYDRYHRIAVYGTEDVEDHRTLRTVWHQHHCDIVATIPESRLLVLPQPFSWEPICNFLEVPVPETPFPWKNRGINTDAIIRVKRANG